MFVVWTILALLTAATALAIAYWTLLTALYPERLRTKEIYTVVTGDLWKLRLCRYRKGRAAGEPVLLVHGSQANHHNFTSPAGGCLIDYLVERGYDCWAIDLRGCRSSTPPFGRSAHDVTMDEYLLYDMPATLEHIAKTTGFARVHWIGHSMGGMLLYAYAQKFGDAQIASGTTLGAPIGFDGVNKQVPADLAPLLRHGRSFVGAWVRGIIPFCVLLGYSGPLFPINFRNRPAKMGTAHFFNMIEDPLPKVLGELGFCLNRKIWRMDNDQLDVKAGLATLKFPLLAIYGNRDPFIPIEQARAFMGRLATEDKQLLVCSKECGCKFDYDHCDLAFGAEGAKEVFEPIARWIAAHPCGEQILHSPSDGADAVVRPLGGIEREGILSGGSYAHLHDESDVLDAPSHSARIRLEEAKRARKAVKTLELSADTPRVHVPNEATVPVAGLPEAAAPGIEIDAIPVDLESTASSALAELEKRLSRTLAATPKPTRSDRIGRAASSLQLVAMDLGEALPVAPATGVTKAKAKATAKAKPKAAAKKPAVKKAPAKKVAAVKPATAQAPVKTKAKAKAKPKAAAKPSPRKK